jgi:hypothetical protein
MGEDMVLRIPAVDDRAGASVGKYSLVDPDDELRVAGTCNGH